MVILVRGHMVRRIWNCLVLRVVMIVIAGMIVIAVMIVIVVMIGIGIVTVTANLIPVMIETGIDVLIYVMIGVLIYVMIAAPIQRTVDDLKHVRSRQTAVVALNLPVNLNDALIHVILAVHYTVLMRTHLLHHTSKKGSRHHLLAFQLALPALITILNHGQWLIQDMIRDTMMPHTHHPNHQTGMCVK